MSFALPPFKDQKQQRKNGYGNLFVQVKKLARNGEH